MQHYPRVAYLRGRPDGHPIHNAYASSIGAYFHFVDEVARWHDISLPSLQRYWRWVQNAWAFPYRKYQGILVEGPHIWPSFAAKIVGIPAWSLIDDHTLYFLYSGFYKKSSYLALLAGLRRYRGLFVIGNMLARLARELLGASCPPLYVGFNGVEEGRLAALLRLRPNLEAPTIVFIGHGEEGWRTFYKGLDILFEALTLASQELRSLQGMIIGRWTEREQARLRSQYPEAPIQFLGPVSALEEILGKASLYVHIARGEAWGIAIQEAMAAGLPAFVSEWTGAAEVVARVQPAHVLPLSPPKVAEAILDYFSLPLAERKALGEAGRELIRTQYTRQQAIHRFQELFSIACREAGLRGE